MTATSSKLVSTNMKMASRDLERQHDARIIMKMMMMTHPTVRERDGERATHLVSSTKAAATFPCDTFKVL